MKPLKIGDFQGRTVYLPEGNGILMGYIIHPLVNVHVELTMERFLPCFMGKSRELSTVPCSSSQSVLPEGRSHEYPIESP